MLLCLASAPALADDWETIVPGGDTTCANGQKYVFHVRRGARDKLMMYWHGGGACWKVATCEPVNSADGVKKWKYRTVPAAERGNDPRTFDGVFALDNAENPFKGWSQIFLPNCTGDFHLGNQDRVYHRDDGTTFTIHHKGRINSQAVFDYAAENFPDLKRVFIAGGSAGGVAAPFYAGEAASMFPAAEIIHFSDGAGGFGMRRKVEQFKIWGTFNDLPEWFDSKRYTEDTTRLIDLNYISAESFPNIKFHQHDTAYDQVQTKVHKYLGYTTPLYAQLKINRAELTARLPYLRHYTSSGDSHTVLRYDQFYTNEVGGVRIVDWVRDIASGKDVDDVDCGTAAECQ